MKGDYTTNKTPTLQTIVIIFFATLSRWFELPAPLTCLSHSTFGPSSVLSHRGQNDVASEFVAHYVLSSQLRVFGNNNGARYSSMNYLGCVHRQKKIVPCRRRIILCLPKKSSLLWYEMASYRTIYHTPQTYRTTQKLLTHYFDAYPGLVWY